MNTDISTQKSWSQAIYITIAVFVVFLLQHYFRRFGRPIETIYFAILFDSIALTGLTLLAASYLTGPLARLWPARCLKYRDLRKQFGLIGLAFVVFHMFIALTLLTPAYYPKMFGESGKLSELGQISMLTGVLGFVILLVIAVTSLPSVAEKMTERGWLIVQRSGLIAVIVSVIHFIVFKWRGWFDPNHWNNGIPPGTLVVAVFILFVFLIRVIAYLSGYLRR